MRARNTPGVDASVDEAFTNSTWFVALPVFGVASFCVLYALASSVYAGVSETGYGHLTNYWCDLLAATSPAGHGNPARPFAVLATFVLPLSLVPLWYHLPRLFAAGARACVAVQVTGCIAMVSATLVWTPMHDLAINVVAVFGFCALLMTLFNIDRRRHRAVGMSVRWAGALVLTNYVLWATGTLVWVIPAVQKAAFLGLFIWVAIATRAISRSLRWEREVMDPSAHRLYESSDAA
ncbi:MAG TPA: hypothetical protein VFQ61_05015 [Polyangiaceae bacterium]|nr:hypothetical protein [Polyangiaceae bacterium]